ncbi:MAG: MFS transporter [Hyphomicrobiaceae bacterium]
MAVLSPLRLLFVVLLPFGAAYCLSYAFRNVNALIAGQLQTELDVGPSELGFLTAVLFLGMAAVQIPFGIALDRYGPRRVQATLLCLAVLGAVVDARANGFVELLAGRALIGIGTATSLMAGLKAIVLWTPPERIASANGTLIMMGALGAVAVTAPAETIAAALGWRGVFVVLGFLALLSCLFVAAVVPDHPVTTPTKGAHPKIKLREIYADPRFQRVAPVSMLCIGSSWALQGLWAAPWLAHVAAFDRPTVVRHLLAMGLALAVGAVALGWITDRLKARGIARETVLAGVAAASLAAQVALVVEVPVPPVLPWMIIAIAGAATTISYAILPGYFAKSISARANAALNLLHLMTAFGLQFAIGGIVDLWPRFDGHPPAQAYQAALAAVATLQGLAITWFVAASPRRRDIVLRVRHPLLQALAPAPRMLARAPYTDALMTYAQSVAAARAHVRLWRGMGVAAGVLCVAIATTVVSWTSSRVIAHVVLAGQEQPSIAGYLAESGGLPVSPGQFSRDARGPSIR